MGGVEWQITSFDDDGDLLEVTFRFGDIWIQFLGSLVFDGRRAVFRGVHVQGPGANRLGLKRLMQLLAFVKATIDVDELRLEGAVRTTGANPDRKPGPLDL